MIKDIYFEKSIRKKSNYISDYSFDDPKNLSKISLNKFKKNLICNYHWNNHKKMKNDYKQLNKFIKKKHKQIYTRLNKYHSLKMNEKYWKIILYPWLVTITYTLYDRWEMVNSVKNKNNLIFHTYSFDKKNLVPTSFKNVKFLNKEFNLMIFSLILEYQKKKLKKKSLIVKNNKIKEKRIIEIILFKMFNVLSLFFKNNLIFNNVGVNFFKTIKLNLYFGQFPYFWINPDYTENKTNIFKRKKFFNKKNKKLKKNFESFFDEIIYLLIPKSYVEDFYSINDAIDKSYWPKICKKIITTYEYKVNDVFKIWCAKMISKKAKYLIIQHGGNFGSSEFEIEEDMQKQVADTFLTWGWKDKFHKNVKPFNAFQLNFIKKKEFIRNDRILICLHFHSKYSYRISSLPKTNFDRLNKLYQVKNLVENLGKSSKIVIRYQKYLEKPFELKFNENFFPKHVEFDRSEKLIKKIISNFKIVIHDTDSTTFLESMFLNIPSILLLDNKVEKFRKTANNFYKDLENNNILFYDPDKAAKFIKKINGTVDAWWFEKNLQKVRKNFCNNFAKKNDNPIKELKKVLI